MDRHDETNLLTPFRKEDRGIQGTDCFAALAMTGAYPGGPQFPVRPPYV